MMIEGKNIGFSYGYDGADTPVLRNVSLYVAAGELVAVLGCNGCGKSTLVRHFNALLPLQQGSLQVAGLDVSDLSQVWHLRRRCGMVFQNPDNQFVFPVVEQDIAFGPENYKVPQEEIAQRVKEALRLVGMEGFEKRSPHTLSGGQRQRIALAGVLVMEPEVLVFDEATAMLDPQGRQGVLALINRLHGMGRTVVMITHYVEEAVAADRVLLMGGGEILASGTPREILTDRAKMRCAGLLPPMPVRLYEDLKCAGIVLRHCPLTEEELVEELCQLR